MNWDSIFNVMVYLSTTLALAGAATIIIYLIVGDKYFCGEEDTKGRSE